MPSIVRALCRAVPQLIEGKSGTASIEVDVSARIAVIDQAPYYTLFFDDDRASLQMESFWRAIGPDGLLFSSTDEDQMFGRQTPFSLQEAFEQSFGTRRITKISLSSPVGDLKFHFDNGSSIEVLAASAGYESWMLYGDGARLICLGGGGLAVF